MSLSNSLMLGVLGNGGASFPDGVRIALILLGGSVSYFGGLVFILCSQANPSQSRMGYLRFWSSVFSRSKLLSRVFLSSPFAPSPSAPNLIFLANGVASLGFEMYRFAAASVERGVWEGFVAHGPLLFVLTMVTINNSMLAWSLHGNGEPNALSKRDKVCMVLAGLGLLTFVIAVIIGLRDGAQAGMPVVWTTLLASLAVRGIAVYGFHKNFQIRLERLRNPETRPQTRPLPPAYGFHFFFVGAVIAFINSSQEWQRWFHSLCIVIQTAYMSVFLEVISYQYRKTLRLESVASQSAQPLS